MNKIFLLIWVSLISCNKNIEVQKRKPNSVEFGKVDLVELPKSLLSNEELSKINNDNCTEKLNFIEAKYKSITPADLDTNQLDVDGKVILDEAFNARLRLHSVLSNIKSDCKLKMKEVYLAMRMVEDFAGVMIYKDEQISADKINYETEKIPLVDQEAYHPYHLNNELLSNGKFEFKNGDIMITKGISFVSSTISEIATPRSLFSHIVFVHVDDQTKAVTTIESYVGKGVAIYPIEEALKNENARILILRYKNSKLASDAANYMYKRVMDLKAKKKFIPYDYALNFNENLKLSCEEVAYDSFKTISNGQIIIPEVESNVYRQDEKFLNRIGIKKGPMMVPGDMETDSRFDIVLDWTDYRIMRDSSRKDAVVDEIFRWSDAYKYFIRENFTSVAARIVWSTRYIPGLWNMMAHVSGLPSDYTKDVPTKTIATMASLKSIGAVLLPEVTKADQDSFKLTGKWMSHEDLRKYLNNYRELHPTDLEKLYRP